MALLKKKGMIRKKIGLAGKSGSGKDLIADYIGDRFGYRKIAVADAIRDECVILIKNLFDANDVAANYMKDVPKSFEVVTNAFVDAVWAKPTTPEIRVLLQFWGTEFRRSQDSEYWTKKLAERLNNEHSIVVSDVRTPSEIDVVHNAGGEVWYVDRPGVASVGITGHYTEVALEGSSFDRTIKNYSTLDDLFEQIDYVFHEC